MGCGAGSRARYRRSRRANIRGAQVIRHAAGAVCISAKRGHAVSLGVVTAAVGDAEPPPAREQWTHEQHTSYQVPAWAGQHKPRLTPATRKPQSLLSPLPT